LEGYQNEELFDFLEESIATLDSPETNLSHFPLVFLLENARHLGFAPELGEGFLIESIHHPFHLEEVQLVLPYLKDLLDHTFHPTTTLPLPLRRKLLDHLVEFHAQHLAHPQPLKSLPIIRQLIG
jgi:DNA repair protein RecO (recombination protein O)